MRRNAFIRKWLCIGCLLGVCCTPVVYATETQNMSGQIHKILNDASLKRDDKVAAIEKLGADGRNAFVQIVLNEEYTIVDTYIVGLVGQLGIKELSPYVLDLLGGPPRGYYWRGIMDTLRELKNPVVAPNLLAILRDDAWKGFVRIDAAHTLLILGSEKQRDEAAVFLSAIWESSEYPEFSKFDPLIAAEIVRLHGPSEYAQQAVEFFYKVWEDPQQYGITNPNVIHRYMWRLEDPLVQAEIMDRWLETGIENDTLLVVKELVKYNDEQFIPLLHKAIMESDIDTEPYYWTSYYNILLDYYDPGISGDKEWMLSELQRYATINSDHRVVLTEQIEPMRQRIIEYFNGPNASVSEHEDTTSP